MSNFNDLIEIVGCDNPDRRGDVIFVHGLGGHARSTWHPQEKHDDDNFWLTWLGEDLPDVGIWSLGYEVEPFKWKGNSMPLADRATNILDLLDSYGIGERPLIFITHSLGGLLVKQMLRNARDYVKWNAISSQTKGIVFLSTPHSGSDMASWIKHIGGILRTTVSVEELEAHHSRLRDLNLLYRNDEQFSQIPMLIYCETRPTGPILVVNQTSADPGIKGVIPVPMDFDHISICKVVERKTQIYRQTKRFIQQNLSLPLPPLEPEKTNTEPIAQGINEGQPQSDNPINQINQDRDNLFNQLLRNQLFIASGIFLIGLAGFSLFKLLSPKLICFVDGSKPELPGSNIRKNLVKNPGFEEGFAGASQFCKKEREREDYSRVIIANKGGYADVALTATI